MPPVTLSTLLHCRWVLFEEKLEMGGGRWSAPHVPTLALPSLQKLRSLLLEGLVLLDCPAQSLLELVGTLGPSVGRTRVAMPSFPSDFPQKYWNFPGPTTPTLGITRPCHKEEMEEQSEGEVPWLLHSLRLPGGKVTWAEETGEELGGRELSGKGWSPTSASQSR